MKEKIVEIGRDSVWYLGANIGAAALGFISIPIFTRIFDPHDYGIYSLVSAAIVLLAPLFYIWLSQSALRFYPEYQKNEELGVFYSTIYHYMPHFLGIIFFILLPVAVFVLPLGQYRVVICLGIAIFGLFTVFMVSLELMRARQFAWQYSVLTVLMAVGRYLVGAGLVVWFSMGVNGIFWGWLGTLVLLVPIELYALRAHRHVKWKDHSPKLNREFLGYGFVLIFGAGFSNILTVADRYIVEIFKGATQVGLYSVVYNLMVNSAAVILSVLVLAATPVLMKTYENEGEEESRHLITRLTRYFLIFLLPSMAGLWVLRVRVMSVISGARYMPAVTAVLPLAMAMVLVNLTWLPAAGFLLKKRTKLMLWPVMVAAVLNIALNFILIPTYGFVGAAWATFACYVVHFILVVAMSRGLMKWEFPWVGATRVLAATAIMMGGLFALRLLPMRGVGGLIVIICLGTILFFAALLLVGGVEPNERRFVLSYASKTLKRKRAA
ncbi:MAG: oligosaccharide flippase family protein [Candidatus Geothermincolia bacterium]